MKILSLIPARGGSKRLPGKNIRVLGDKPLINWSIDVCKNSSHISDVLVSTDDEGIRQIALNAGALAPWLRPAELSTDSVPSIDVALHALDWYEVMYGKIDGVMLLQPTSPYRTKATIERGIALFAHSGFKPVVAISLASSHPMWCFSIDNGKLLPISEEGLHTRSQDLPPAYAVNGSFYLTTPDHLRSSRSFYGSDMVPLIIDSPIESLDIDTEFDWKIAQTFLSTQTNKDMQ